MKIINKKFFNISDKEILLFIGRMVEKESFIELINRFTLGELKMYILNTKTEYKY